MPHHLASDGPIRKVLASIPHSSMQRRYRELISKDSSRTTRSSQRLSQEARTFAPDVQMTRHFARDRSQRLPLSRTNACDSERIFRTQIRATPSPITGSHTSTHERHTRHQDAPDVIIYNEGREARSESMINESTRLSTRPA